MAIQDRATNILAELQGHEVGSRPLCFVTHSMGGLLVKEMLLQAAESQSRFGDFARVTKGVAFLSTPHTGSGLTQAVDALNLIYRGTQAIKDLKQNNAYLRQLGDRYRNLSDKLSLRNLVLYETQSTKGIFVVDPTSANPGLIGVSPIPVDANHTSICKPTSSESLVYKQIKRFIDEARMSVDQARSDNVKALSSPSDQTSALSPGLEILRRPIRELDPFDLEVHPAISPGHDAGDLPALPTYVNRPHDVQLRNIVQSAVSGKNAIAVLVGTSSSGKTRAVWEAVCQLPDTWSLWHPLSPARPRAVLDGIDRIPPRTVIWLNELQHYIVTSPPEVGEEVAARLRTLLRDDRKAPVLVLGTIWPEYIAKVVEDPTYGELDPRSHARSLISSSDIVVPDHFTKAELATVRETEDPRLAQAFAQSKSGEIAQYLAGAPALVRRYETAPPAAQAVIKVAIDGQRIGCTAALTIPFIKRAAAGYLSENQWMSLGENWLDQALEYTSFKTTGTAGLLVQHRPRPGLELDNPPQYQLADYIAQWGRKARCFEVPPTEFWEAGINCLVASEEIVLLGDAAAARWRIRHAAMLYQRAITMGCVSGLHRMGELEEKRGNIDQAQNYFREAAEAGMLVAQLKIAHILQENGDMTGAGHWLRLAANQGEFRALQSLATIAEETGDETKAIALLHEAVELASFRASGPLRQLARLQERLGAAKEAAALRERAKRGAQTVTRRSVEDIAARSGGLAALKRKLQGRVSEAQAKGVSADEMDLELLAEAYEADGELSEAEAIATLAAQEDDLSALLSLVAERFNRGQLRDAERLARMAADAGDSYGLQELARCSPTDLRLQQILRFGLEPDGQTSPPNG